MLPSPFHNLRKALGSLVTEADYKRPSGAPITKASGGLNMRKCMCGRCLGKVTDAIGLWWQNLRPRGHPGGHPVSTPSCCSSHRYPSVIQLQKLHVPSRAANSSPRVAAQHLVEHYRGGSTPNHGAFRRSSFWSSKFRQRPAQAEAKLFILASGRCRARRWRYSGPQGEPFRGPHLL